MGTKQTQVQKVKAIDKAIKELEALQGNRSIVGVYLSDECISRFIITLYNTKETVINEEN